MVVAVLSGLYVLHMILVVLDGCHDQNLARAYTELLQVTRRKAKLRDRIRDSQSIVRKAVWPVKVRTDCSLLLGMTYTIIVYIVRKACQGPYRLFTFLGNDIYHYCIHSQESLSGSV